MKESNIDTVPVPVVVSVVITCFNYGCYLATCLQSVLAQTFHDYEIIVIDDGSTDNTAEAMQQYLSLSCLRYIRQVNIGQARSKNRGVELARGKYVAFLDADDIWEKDKLEKQIKLFELPEVGVVYSKARLIDDNANVKEVGDWGVYLQPRSGWVTDWLLFDNFVWFSSSIVRKIFLERYGVFDENLVMGIDWDLWLRLSMHCKFDFVDESLLLYRMGHEGQMSKNLKMRFASADIILRNFLSNNPQLENIEMLRKVKAYAFCNRGNYYCSVDRWQAALFFLRALLLNPSKRACWGLVKTLSPFRCKSKKL